MAKNNHVFNHFDKTLRNAFSAFLVEAKISVDLNMALISQASPDARAMSDRYPRAYIQFRNTLSAHEFKIMKTMQDYSVVATNDSNSEAYGRAASQFISAVSAIAKLPARGASPGAYWEAMVKTGFDAGASERYINGADARSTVQRRKQVEDMKTFIKGQLNHNVATWIQLLKLDHAHKR